MLEQNRRLYQSSSTGHQFLVECLNQWTGLASRDEREKGLLDHTYLDDYIESWQHAKQEGWSFGLNGRHGQ